MFVQCVINSERKLSCSELCRSDSDSCKQFIVKMTQPNSHFLILFNSPLLSFSARERVQNDLELKTLELL